MNCDFIDAATDETIQCGKITVLEDHDNPQSRQIELVFTRLRAQNDEATNFPLIYFTGGPGGNALTINRIKGWKEHPIRQDHDVILFDQRGTGMSTPLPNMEGELFRIMAADATMEEELELMHHMLDRFKSIIDEEGIDVRSYNSFQNARDVGALMDALEYEKFSVYGSSYGTRLARIVQDMFPNRVHASVLNSPSVLGLDFLVDRMEAYSMALERILSFCEGDPNCSTQYPDVRNAYFQAIEGLKKEPLTTTASGQEFVVNAQDAVYLLRRRLYANNAQTNIPRLITAFRDREEEAFSGIAETEFLFSQNYNSTMFLSVERYEMFDPRYDSEVVDSLYKTMALFPAKLGMFTNFYLAGKEWHNAELPIDERDFLPSTTPTLITVNYYDPVTPPRNGEMVMRRLSNGQLYVLDEAGHGGGNQDCRNKVIVAFLKNPEQALDTSCLNLHAD